MPLQKKKIIKHQVTYFQQNVKHPKDRVFEKAKRNYKMGFEKRKIKSAQAI